MTTSMTSQVTSTAPRLKWAPTLRCIPALDFVIAKLPAIVPLITTGLYSRIYITLRIYIALRVYITLYIPSCFTMP